MRAPGVLGFVLCLFRVYPTSCLIRYLHMLEKIAPLDREGRLGLWFGASDDTDTEFLMSFIISASLLFTSHVFPSFCSCVWTLFPPRKLLRHAPLNGDGEEATVKMSLGCSYRFWVTSFESRTTTHKLRFRRRSCTSVITTHTPTLPP